MSLLDYVEVKERMEMQDLLKYLPLPYNTLELTGSKYGMKKVFSFWAACRMMDSKEFVQHEWVDLYYSVLTGIAKLLVGIDEYIIFKLHPTVSRGNLDADAIIFSLVAEIMIAPTKNVCIPTFTYGEVLGETKVIEWRCGYCNSVNEIKERHCTQCGATRAKLLQEMI